MSPNFDIDERRMADDNDSSSCELSTNSPLEIPYAMNDSDNGDDDSDTPGIDSPDRAATIQRREPLRPGDVIAYMCPMFTAGHKDGQRRAVVLGTNPAERNFPLLLDNSEQLPWDTCVQRIGEYSRGEIHHHPGKLRPISKFQMTKSGSQDASAALRKRAQKLKQDMDQMAQRAMDVLAGRAKVQEKPSKSARKTSSSTSRNDRNAKSTKKSSHTTAMPSSDDDSSEVPVVQPFRRRNKESTLLQIDEEEDDMDDEASIVDKMFLTQDIPFYSPRNTDDPPPRRKSQGGFQLHKHNLQSTNKRNKTTKNANAATKSQTKRPPVTKRNKTTSQSSVNSVRSKASSLIGTPPTKTMRVSKVNRDDYMDSSEESGGNAPNQRRPSTRRLPLPSQIQISASSPSANSALSRLDDDSPLKRRRTKSLLHKKRMETSIPACFSSDEEDEAPKLPRRRRGSSKKTSAMAVETTTGSLSRSQRRPPRGQPIKKRFDPGSSDDEDYDNDNNDNESPLSRRRHGAKQPASTVAGTKNQQRPSQDQPPCNKKRLGSSLPLSSDDDDDEGDDLDSLVASNGSKRPTATFAPPKPKRQHSKPTSRQYTANNSDDSNGDDDSIAVYGRGLNTTNSGIRGDDRNEAAKFNPENGDSSTLSMLLYGKKTRQRQRRPPLSSESPTDSLVVEIDEITRTRTNNNNKTTNKPSHKLESLARLPTRSSPTATSLMGSDDDDEAEENASMYSAVASRMARHERRRLREKTRPQPRDVTNRVAKSSQEYDDNDNSSVEMYKPRSSTSRPKRRVSNASVEVLRVRSPPVPRKRDKLAHNNNNKSPFDNHTRTSLIASLGATTPTYSKRDKSSKTSRPPSRENHATPPSTSTRKKRRIDAFSDEEEDNDGYFETKRRKIKKARHIPKPLSNGRKQEAFVSLIGRNGGDSSDCEIIDSPTTSPVHKRPPKRMTDASADDELDFDDDTRRRDGSIGKQPRRRNIKLPNSSCKTTKKRRHKERRVWC